MEGQRLHRTVRLIDASPSLTAMYSYTGEGYEYEYAT